jgi:hypothetical protein
MSLAAQFLDLFQGNDRAHGVFNVTPDKAGKQKGVARIIREATTEALWDLHLKGEEGLGVIPIKDNQHCHWGAIDVDKYDIDHKALVQKLEKFKIPAVVGRSKSGGAHVFFFFQSEIPAEDLHPKLTEIAATLGHAGCEIFPKQTSILVERGDTGNFLNMPYFAGERTTRFAYDAAGESMTPEEFLEYASVVRMQPDYFLSLKFRSEKAKTILPEGPPCLQHLAEQGFGEGSRNNALFNLGVYARMAEADRWQEILSRYNMEYMNPPLTHNEVGIIIRQIEKKDYFYKCEDQPINAHCNKPLCMTRKFGVGPGQTNNTLSSLTKIDGDPPIWLLDVDGQRVELSTEALVTQTRFQRECVAQINKYPIQISQRAWQTRMQLLLDNLTVVEVPPDATLAGEFEDHFRSFCCDRARGENREDILHGVPVWNNGRIYFQVKDVKKHLNANDFEHFTSNKITLWLRDKGAEKMFWRVHEKGIHVWSLPDNFFSTGDQEQLALPPRSKKDVI